MSKIEWNATGERYFEVGIDRGVLYVGENGGVPWNGLSKVDEKPVGGSATPYYYDGAKYANVSSAEEYGATLTAYTYPDEFAPCDGWGLVDTGMFIRRQPRVPFSLSYRSLIGNDVDGTSHAYKIHLIYNALAEPTESNYATLTDSSDPGDFSWSLSVLPPFVNGFRSSGHLVLDTRLAHPGTISDLEDALYGTDASDPYIPDFAEVLTMVGNYADFTVTDNGNGTFRITAPSSAMTDNGDGTYELNSDAATDNGDDTWTVGTT
jgi:hypothetical protein